MPMMQSRDTVFYVILLVPVTEFDRYNNNIMYDTSTQAKQILGGRITAGCQDESNESS
jgi:hypothetical protein